MTINHARTLLGNSSNKFSDNEIEDLINQFAGIAEIITQTIGSKQTTRGIASTPGKVDDSHG